MYICNTFLVDYEQMDRGCRGRCLNLIEACKF